MKEKRVIWIILDSVGIGETPDASRFGDKGADTLGHIYEYMNKRIVFSLPNMEKLGLGNIDGINQSIKNDVEPIGIYCKAKEISMGKDTTIGHWEMCGVETKLPFPTYPKGFPKDILDKFIKEANIPGVLGNKVASGTEIIEELGDEHILTKKPIIYTSADSVFQIACHEDVYDNEKLYQMCQIARKLLVGEHGVARVIARPFIGKDGIYTRTAERRDFSVIPPENNLLSILEKNNIPVYAIGKIEDIFAGSGIYKAVHTRDNMDGVDRTLEYMDKYSTGLIYTNLVEYDSKWGHRRDVEGYAKGLLDFDCRLPEIISKMSEDDLLVINSDHGCDPTFKGTDHTREYIPILIYNKGMMARNAHVRENFADVGATIAAYLGVKIELGNNILKED